MSQSKPSPTGGHDVVAASPATDPTKKRLLLIEDENAARVVLLQKMRAAGFVVDVAPNGRVAIEKLRSSQPDAIFMDLLLPQVKGVDVIKEARRTRGFGNRPIYVCTSAANMEAWTRRGTQAGATKVFDRAATAIDAIVAAVAADLLGPGVVKDATEPQPHADVEPEAVPEPPLKLKAPVAASIIKTPVAAPVTPPPAAPSPPPAPASAKAFSTAFPAAPAASHRPPPSLFQRALKAIGLTKSDGSSGQPSASESPAPLRAPERPSVFKPATLSARTPEPVATAAPTSQTTQAAPPAPTAPAANPGVSTREPEATPLGAINAPSAAHGGAVLTLDQAGKILSADEGCVAMFGWEAAMLVDVDLKVLLKEGLEKGVEAFLQRHRGGDPSKSSGSAPVIARRRDGTEFPVSVTTLTWSSETTVTRKSDAARSCWTVVFRDLTSVANSPVAAVKVPQTGSLGTGFSSRPPNEDLSRLQQSHAVLQKTNSELQKQVRDLAAEAATQREALAQSQKELQQAQSASQRTEQARKQLENRLQDLTASNAQQDQQAAEPSQHREASWKIPAPLRDHLAEAQAEAERARAGLAFQQEVAGTHQLAEELAKLRLSHEELSHKLTAEQQAAAESKRRSEELENRLRETAGELECLKADGATHSEETECLESALREQLTEAQKAAEKAEANVKKETARNQDLERRLQILGSNLKQEQNERSKRFEQELAALRKERDDLNARLTTEQQAAAESKRRVEELEARLRDNAAAYEIAKSELDKQTADQKRSEAEWRGQLETAKALTRTLEQACAEAVELNSRFEGEMAVLQHQRDELQKKLTEEQRLAAEPKRRVEELDFRLRENAAELERVKSALQATGRDMTAEMELVSLEQVRDALSAKLTAERWATTESTRRTEDLESRLQANSAELERVKADRDKQAEAHARLEADLREQLDATKNAVEQVAAALTEKAAKCNHLQTELAGLHRSRDELGTKLSTEQQAVAESRQRSQELEGRLNESAAELERYKAEREKQAEQQARLDSELQAQLAAAKAATELVEADLKRETARCSRFEEELASLQKERRQLRDKFDASQQTELKSKRRIRELEDQLREREAGVASVKLELQTHAAERTRTESDLRAQLEAAKSATQKAEAARHEQTTLRGRLEEELAGLRRSHEELGASCKTEQRAVEESRRRISDLEKAMGERAAEFQRAKTAFENQAAERGRIESELRAQLEAAKGAAQKAEAARQEQSTQRSRLEEELANLRRGHEELGARCRTEQRTAEESRRRIAELEKAVGEKTTEVQRAKTAFDNQATERGRIESDLRSQLETAKGAARESEAARQTQTAQLGRLEKELAGLRKKQDELGAKGKADKQAADESRRRIAELEKAMSEKSTELQRTKTAFENQSAERGRIESELRTQLEAAKSGAQKAEAARQEQTTQRGRLQEELNTLRKSHEELGAKSKTDQSAVEESRRRIADLEKSLRESATELQRTKTALEKETAERSRLAAKAPKTSGNTEALTKELCRLREEEAVRAAELSDLRRQTREGVGSSARLTADLEKERAERRRVEQRAAALTAQLQELHGELKQHLESASAGQKRISDMEQQLREREDSVTRVNADLQKEAASRQLAEEQLRSTADLNGHLRNCLSSFELAKKGFKRMQEELESRQQANLNALKETEAKLQAEAGERKRLEDALAAAQRNIEEQSQKTSLELTKLQSELEVEKFEQKRLQGEAMQSRYSSLDSARVGQAMVNSFRKQIEQPVEHLMQSTRRLLESQLEAEQKKLVEALLENALLLRTSLQESGPSNAGGDRAGALKSDPVRPPGLMPERGKPNLQP